METQPSLIKALAEHDLLLMEAAVTEALQRRDGISVHPELGPATCIHDPAGRQALTGLYSRFTAAARAGGTPLIITAPTWRTNPERIDRAGCPKEINREVVNCSYPSFFKPEGEPPRVIERLIGYQANASSLEHQELDGTDSPKSDDLADWSDRMAELHRRWGLKILGGCCGTEEGHLLSLVRRLRP